MQKKLYKEKTVNKVFINLSTKVKGIFINILIPTLLLTDISIVKASESRSLNSAPNINYLNKINTNSYILGEGDLIKILINRNIPSLTGEYTISGEGEIVVPKLNRIYVSGLTIKELTNLLNERYKEFVKYPQVEITISRYRPVNFYLTGEVDRPGLYSLKGAYSFNKLAADKPIENEVIEDTKTPDSLDTSFAFYFPTVFDGIRTAGGITSYSDLSKVTIIRKNTISNGGGSISTSINLLSMLETGNSSQNIRIQDGDVIKVKKSSTIVMDQLSQAIKSNINPRFISIFVMGNVTDPGKKNVSRSSTLNDAILIAGGARVIRGPITFIRYRSDGNIEKRSFNYSKNSPRGSYQNPLLRSGDIISINKNIINVATEVLNELTQPFIGIFATKEVLERFNEF